MSDMADWCRPESIPYPSIWRTFERTKETGIKQKYWVQDLTPVYENEFLHAMKTGFLVDEILCKHCNYVDDAQTVQDTEELWKNVLKDKLALICLTENSEGQVQIVGGNLTTRAYKDQPHDMLTPSKGRQYRQVISILEYPTDLVDVCSELGIDSYLTAMGLYVLPEFRGKGIGAEILRARKGLSLAVGLKASVNVFTSITSQKTAAQAGFMVLVEIAYEDIAKSNPEYKFLETIQSTKFLKLMYARYD